MDLDCLSQYRLFHYIPPGNGPRLFIKFFKVQKDDCGIIELFSGKSHNPLCNMLIDTKEIKDFALEEVSETMDIISFTYGQNKDRCKIYAYR